MRLKDKLKLIANSNPEGINQWTGKHHEDFKKVVAQHKKELKADRSLSPAAKESQLRNRVLPNADPTVQKDVDQLKQVAESVRKKDPVAAEWLDNAHEALVDKEGKFDAYGDAGTSHGYLKMAEKEIKGVTDKMSPRLRAWIKLHPARGTSDTDVEDLD